MSSTEAAKSTKPTLEQIAEAARIIEASFDPETGRHPSEIFHAICKTTVRPVVELAIFSLDKQEILLTQREDDDLHYSGAWHLPGVMVVTADLLTPDPYANAAMRALGELKGTRVISLQPLSPKWIKPEPRYSVRGGEIPWIYGGLLVDERPLVGEMARVDDLPKPIHEHHPALAVQAQDAMAIAPAVDLRPY